MHTRGDEPVQGTDCHCITPQAEPHPSQTASFVELHAESVTFAHTVQGSHTRSLTYSISCTEKVGSLPHCIMPHVVKDVQFTSDVSVDGVDTYWVTLHVEMNAH